MFVCRFYSARIPWPMANFGGCSVCGFSSQGEAELSVRLLELAFIDWIIEGPVELPYLLYICI